MLYTPSDKVARSKGVPNGGKFNRQTCKRDMLACWYIWVLGKFFLPKLDFNLGLALAPLSIFRTSTNLDRTITNQDRAAANRDRNANRYSLL